ncbi:MAG: helix-turn-helix domain-containing protein, partial [Pseudomonadota bacterium]
TQQELAALIFSQREAVGREMSRLRDLGLIERSGRRLTLLDVPALRARAGQ